MKKSIFILVMSAFMVGLLGTGCKKETVNDATHEEQQDTKIKMEEKNTEIDEAEWNKFMKDMDAEMKADEMLIKDLKSESKKSSKKQDAAYVKSVDSLEKKHAELEAEIKNYDKNQKDWDSFKSRFKNALDTLGKELNNLKTNKK